MQSPRPSAATASAAAISLRGVEKRFGDRWAVRDLDLEIPRGSLCGVLGPNGAGKSTTIRMVLSILYPDAGEIRVLGADALSAKARIGYLPEERGLYRTMRVGEYLGYIARLKGAPRHGLASRIQHWLGRIDLADVYKRRCQELSKGMQQKVQFLAAVIHEPELLILDEPFSGLDPVNAVVLDRLVSELHAEGRTILLCTHVMHQAEKICDRVVLIHRGAKRLDATLPEIRQRFDPRSVRYEPLAIDGELRARLARLSGVAAVTPSRTGAAFELTLEQGRDRQVLLRELLELGPARAIELSRVTLEEVFVRVVRESEGADAASQAKEELERAQGS
ncbi:MAG: ATP-binding cassette domain-containing protein [Planctomycetes bacterium]|nr:ATP-binding cassette domain-containing protein [Planctomycetota bacterium]